MAKVIGVRFKTSARIYYFDPLDLPVAEGDGVIVETARGMEFGDVQQGIRDVDEHSIVQPLKPVIRIATDEDKRLRAENAAKEKDAFDICQRKIAQHGLDMRLVDVEYTFNGSKVVFYFTADERVDFRELVKDLASQFRTRIELRQIGVRDEAKMIGGLGSCGRPVCCKTFLDEFRPVSIKMAKEQNLSLSPTKISGLCGRLMCCLQYEQSAYEDMKKRMPRTGRDVLTPDGVGIAVENNAVTERTKVRLMLPDGTIEMRDYHYTELAKPGDPVPVALPRKPEPEKLDSFPAYVVPEPAAGQAETETDEKEADGQPPRKKRRRGGRGRNGNKPAGEAGEANKQPPAQTADKPQPQGKGAQPKQEQTGGQKPNGADGAPRPANKRRRRGGAGRNKKPNAPQPTE